MSAGEDRYRDGKRKTRYLNQIENAFKPVKHRKRKPNGQTKLSFGEKENEEKPT